MLRLWLLPLLLPDSSAFPLKPPPLPPIPPFPFYLCTLTFYALDKHNFTSTTIATFRKMLLVGGADLGVQRD